MMFPRLSFACTLLTICCISAASSNAAPVSFIGSYSNDFNTDITGWSPVPVPGSTPVGFIDATSGDWGGNFDEYWSADAGDGDRALTVYKGASGDTTRWQLELVNDTNGIITALDITYDAEVPWVRLNNNPRDARVDWFLNTGSGFSKVGTPSPVITNASATDLTTWLTDTQMDNQSLAVRDLALSLTGLSIAPGQSFALAFGSDGRGGTNNSKNMNFGIDGFGVDATVEAAVPEPSSIALFSVAGLGLAHFVRRRSRKTKQAE